MPQIEVSPGELLDRASVLVLKVARIADPAKVRLARGQLDALAPALAAIDRDAVADLADRLDAVNAELWDVIDAQHALERAGELRVEYIDLCRSVNRLNGLRSALKRRIDEQLGYAPLSEVKSHPDP
ncbi:MAG TPA: hypothetical protein VG406_09065 [Isosphaeraceae bacterium]|jgi:hypothetical protein|nr:hypothetical protein [Isosphaeraceae bacterium]